jgi:hypothetical protein
MKTKNTKINGAVASLPDQDNKTPGLTTIYSDFPTVIPHVDRVADFIEFAKWFATPHALRQPKTQKDFAAAIVVSQDTLTDWKRHYYFWPLAQKFINEWVKERIPDAIAGLYRNACGKGKAKDVEAFLRLGLMGSDTKKIKNTK